MRRRIAGGDHHGPKSVSARKMHAKRHCSRCPWSRSRRLARSRGTAPKKKAAWRCQDGFAGWSLPYPLLVV